MRITRCSLARCLVYALLLGLLGACSHPQTRLREIRVQAAADANQDSATALDFVWAQNAATAQTLPAESASWFAQKASRLAALDLQVVSLQVPAATTIASVALPQHAAHGTVFGYANMLSPAGQARLSLDGLRCAEVTIGAQTLNLRETCPSRCPLKFW